MPGGSAAMVDSEDEWFDAEASNNGKDKTAGPTAKRVAIMHKRNKTDVQNEMTRLKAQLWTMQEVRGLCHHCYRSLEIPSDYKPLVEAISVGTAFSEANKGKSGHKNGSTFIQVFRKLSLGMILLNIGPVAALATLNDFIVKAAKPKNMAKYILTCRAKKRGGSRDQTPEEINKTILRMSTTASANSVLDAIIEILEANGGNLITNVMPPPPMERELQVQLTALQEELKTAH
jgi:hypothetical protein